MMKKTNLFFVIFLLFASVPVLQAGVQQIVAGGFDVEYDASELKLSIVNGNGLKVIYEDDTQTLYDNGGFSFSTYLDQDNSANYVEGSFNGGSLTFTDDNGDELLTGDNIGLELSDVSGVLSGPGEFSVTGGSLQNEFTSLGKIFHMEFFINPSISDFASDFTASSSTNVTPDPDSLPIPEPATIAILGLGGLTLFRKKRDF